MSENFITIVGAIVVTVAVLALIAVLLAFPVMWLWNWLMPAIFGLVKINFWKALGINLLCGLLFKSSYSSKKN